MKRFEGKVVLVSNAADLGIGHGDTLTMTEEMLFGTLTGHESDGRDVAEGVAFLASPGARTFQGARLVMDSGSSTQLYPASCEDDTSNMRQK